MEKDKGGFLELVNRRYSVRDFEERPVKREDIATCLEAARLAPSACNSQPWKFIIVDDVALKNTLCDCIFTGTYKLNRFAGKAPVLVVVVSLKGSFLTKIGGMIRDTKYYLIDIGIAVEHFILQATELGLGTCWIGWFNEKEAKRILKIPRNQKIDVVIPVGYAAKPSHQKVRKSMEEMAEFR